MSQDSTTSDAVSTPLGNSNDMPDRVFLVSYPKIVYLYPTVLAALFCGIFMWAKGGMPQEEVRVAGVRGQAVANASQVNELQATPFADISKAPAEAANDSTNTGSDADAADAKPVEVEVAKVHTYHNVCARIFLVIMSLNLVVIAFDFPRTTSLTWFFAIAFIVIALWFILTLNSWLAPQIVSALLKIKPAANASFYLIFSGIMIFLYLGVLVSRRFDYWEVKGNELLHHHGFLSNLERFSAPNLRIDKEINDVFEYLLLQSGRLIIHASNERRAIVLENVLFINQKEERITKMLGALQVRVRTDRES